MTDSGDPNPLSRGLRRDGERFIRNQDRWNLSPAQARRVVRWWVALSEGERAQSLAIVGADSITASNLASRDFLKLPIEWQVRLERAWNRDYNYTQATQLPGVGTGNSHVRRTP